MIADNFIRRDNLLRGDVYSIADLICKSKSKAGDKTTFVFADGSSFIYDHRDEEEAECRRGHLPLIILPEEMI